MARFQSRLRLVFGLGIQALSCIGWEGRALAQSGDGWSYLLKTQAWLSHIGQNGFAAAPVSSVFGGNVFAPPPGNIVSPITSSSSSSVEAISPQWGIQVAAQKSRLTLAGAFQYVNFET